MGHEHARAVQKQSNGSRHDTALYVCRSGKDQGTAALGGLHYCISRRQAGGQATAYASGEAIIELTYYRALSHNLEGPVARMVPSHQLLVRAWQQELKPVLVSCRKLLVQLQHIVPLMKCPDEYCSKPGRHRCVEAV